MCVNELARICAPFSLNSCGLKYDHTCAPRMCVHAVLFCSTAFTPTALQHSHRSVLFCVCTLFCSVLQHLHRLFYSNYTDCSTAITQKRSVLCVHAGATSATTIRCLKSEPLCACHTALVTTHCQKSEPYHAHPFRAHHAALVTTHCLKGEPFRAKRVTVTIHCRKSEPYHAHPFRAHHAALVTTHCLKSEPFRAKKRYCDHTLPKE